MPPSLGCAGDKFRAALQNPGKKRLPLRSALHNTSKFPLAVT